MPLTLSSLTFNQPLKETDYHERQPSRVISHHTVRRKPGDQLRRVLLSSNDIACITMATLPPEVPLQSSFQAASSSSHMWLVVSPIPQWALTFIQANDTLVIGCCQSCTCCVPFHHANAGALWELGNHLCRPRTGNTVVVGWWFDAPDAHNTITAACGNEVV